MEHILTKRNTSTAAVTLIILLQPPTEVILYLLGTEIIHFGPGRAEKTRFEVALPYFEKSTPKLTFIYRISHKQQKMVLV